MANTYYNFSPQFIPGQKVRSDEMNQQLSALESAFDLLPTDNSAILRGTTFLGVESGSVNAIEIALTDPRTAYQDGDQISFKANTTNTGPSTIDIDGVGIVNLVGADGTAVGAGDITSGLYFTAIFDSANNRWQMLGASAASLLAADERVTWASEWAVNPVGVPVSTDAGGDGVSDFSAFHWASSASADAGFAATSESNAATSESNAATSETNAANSAAGVNLPSIVGGDVGKQLRVNVGETGYELFSFASGSGSGLDADLLDAQHGTFFLARGNHTGTQLLATISDAGALAAKSTVNNDDWSGADLTVPNGGTGVGTFPVGNILLGNGTGGLTSASQGAAGGIDSDLLDSQHGTYYLARSNHTGTQLLSTISNAGDLAAKSTINNGDWSGTDLAVANGGTGRSTLTDRAVLVGRVVSGIAQISPSSTVGRPFVAKGTGSNPGYSPDILVQTAEYERVDNGDTGSNQTINWNSGSLQTSNITNHVTYSFTDPSESALLVLKTRRASASKTVSFPTKVKGAPAEGTNDNGIDVYFFFFDGSNYHTIGSLIASSTESTYP